jgi:hypothetical protein
MHIPPVAKASVPDYLTDFNTFATKHNFTVQPDGSGFRPVAEQIDDVAAARHRITEELLQQHGGAIDPSTPVLGSFIARIKARRRLAGIGDEIEAAHALAVDHADREVPSLWAGLNAFLGKAYQNPVDPKGDQAYHPHIMKHPEDEARFSRTGGIYTTFTKLRRASNELHGLVNPEFPLMSQQAFTDIPERTNAKELAFVGANREVAKHERHVIHEAEEEIKEGILYNTHLAIAMRDHRDELLREQTRLRQALDARTAAKQERKAAKQQARANRSANG